MSSSARRSTHEKSNVSMCARRKASIGMVFPFSIFVAQYSLQFVIMVC